MKIGFIGQGWIGKNYADALEDGGYEVVRYALEEPFLKNREVMPSCDIVFIAVPTPSTPEGFDDTNVRDALQYVGVGKTAVIKSTILPGTTRRLAETHPDKFVLHAPEFLRESYARYDVDNPERVIVGMPFETPEYRSRAEQVLAVHPRANYQKITSAEEAEFIKYTHNTFGYVTIVYANLMYDLAQKIGVDWGVMKEAILNNSWYPSKYLDPNHKGGRGAGGHCFIKDFAALRELFERELPEDKEALSLLHAFETKNNKMLRESGKDLDLLEGVYGKLDEDISEMEEVLMKEGDDIEAMASARKRDDLPTLEAAYIRAGEDLAKLADAYEETGEDLTTIEAISDGHKVS